MDVCERMENKPFIYCFRLNCLLGSSSIAFFPEMVIRTEDCGETILTGAVADQAALHGILMRIRDLGLPLIEVKRMDDFAG